MENKITLHEAIVIVLEEAKMPLKATVIANEINNRGLYQRNDKNAVPASQIHARVKNYQNLFIKNDGYISLVHKKQRGAKPSQIDETVNEIWKQLELSASLSSQDCSIVLFFLFIKKEFPDVLSTYSNYLKLVLQETIVQSQYSSFLNHFTNIIKQVNEKQLSNIAFQIHHINDSFFTQNYLEIFESFVQKIEFSALNNNLTNPKELNQLIKFLSGNKEDINIFNPFAGTLPILSQFKNSNIVAQEINPLNWAIGMLRINALGLKSSISFLNPNNFNYWDNQNKYDLIVSTPPFGFKIENTKGAKKAELFFLEKALQSINEKGKIIAVLPENFLVSNGNDELTLKKKLIQEDLIETIILLPKNLFAGTNFTSVCLVINPTKTNKQSIKIVDASLFFTKSNRNQVNLNLYLIQEKLSSSKDDEHTKLVSNNQIVNNQYVISVKKLLLSESNGQNLSAFLTPAVLNPPVKNEGKVLKINDLKDDFHNNDIFAHSIAISPINYNEKSIHQSCILLTLKGKNLKASYFNYQGEEIYISSNILALTFNPDEVDKNYLIFTLNHSESFLNQLNASRTNGIIPTISKSDFLNLKLDLPNISQQNQIWLKVKKEVSMDLETLWEENVVNEQKNIYQEFSSLKHSTGTPRQNILSNAKTLIRFFEKEDSEAFFQLNQKFKNRYQIDLISILNLIKQDISHISEMLDMGEKALILSNYDYEKMSISDITNYFQTLSHHNYNFSIQTNYWDFTLNKLFLEDVKPEEYILSDDFGKDSLQALANHNSLCIEGNWTLFKILIENILTNAHKHGFEDKSIKNMVQIDLELHQNELVVKLKNNGKAFPNDFTKEKFTAKFITSNRQIGTGLGGYDIDRIAAFFKNKDWKLDLDAQDEYPVLFEFNFNVQTLV